MGGGAKIKQQLNNYLDKYSNYKKWLKKETSHYVFCYLSDTDVERDIEKISQRQEKAFEKIIRTLNIAKPKEKVRYYIYPNQEIKEELTGVSGYAQSIYHDFTVHVVYNKEIDQLGEHEDTHLLSLPLGLAIGFFQEGLAEYMAGNRMWQGRDQIFWLKEALDKNIISNIESMMTQQAWIDSPDEDAPYYYILAKSFVSFLIDNFGMKKFKEFYSRLDRLHTKDENIKIFEEVYGISVGEAEKNWKNNIRTEILSI